MQYSYGRSFNQKRRLRNHGFFEQVEVEEAEKADCGMGPESAFGAAGQDATILVQHIMPHLTNKQRHVIEKAFFEGMKLSEVASQTGEPIGNIRHAYYRGIEKLRSVLAGESFEKPSPAEPGAEEKEKETGKNSERRMSWLKKPRSAARPLAREVDIG